MDVPSPPVTAVIGAGPAGLLFCLVARLHWEATAPPDQSWPIYLFDKRESYARTHRLRVDPEPFLKLQSELAAQPFDRLIAALEALDFRPEINELESTLATLVGELGIHRELAVLGQDAGELDIAELRARLVSDGRLGASAPVTIVGADSVRSATRRLVEGDGYSEERIHHVVARLRVSGPGLPDRLGHIHQFKLAKVLGSALDYRLNSNGFAEVDLFLSPAEHAGVEALASKPTRLVPVGPDTVADAPFFSAIVRNLEFGFGSGRCQVAVQSTFRLEHRYQTKATFHLPNDNTTVCLVGDAAISLPFFRGMAALAASVHQLAYLQVAWAAACAAGDPAAHLILDHYDAQLEDIRRREVRVVEARSTLVDAARELVRLSSLMPFPIQQWFLSTETPERSGGRMTPGAAVNLVLAVIAGFVALAAPLIGGLVWAPLGWLWLAAVPLEFIGGGTFHLATIFETGVNPLLGRIWRTQIALLLFVGVPITVFTSVLEGRVAQIFGAVGWFLLGLAFAAGLVVSERIQARRVAAAALDDV